MKPVTTPAIRRGPSKIRRIGQQAVREAQDDLRAKGILLCFSRNGRIYYEMPDGSIQTENPYPALLRARGLPGGEV